MGRGVTGTIVDPASTNGVGGKGIVSALDPAQANKKRRFMNTEPVLTNFIAQMPVESVLEVSSTTRNPTLNSLYQWGPLSWIVIKLFY